MIVGPTFFSSPVGDPYYGDTILIMNCDQPDGSTTFIDTSPLAQPMVGNGGASIVDQFASLDGVDDVVLVTGPGPEWDIGTDDITIEVVADLASLPSLWTLITNRSSSFSFVDTGFILIGNSLGAFQGVVWGPPNPAAVVNVNIIAPAGTVTTGLHHFCLQRSGSTWTLGYDGVAVGTATSSAAMGFEPSFDIQLGDDASAGGRHFHGKMRARVTRGVARYTFPFTPSFDPWPDPT